jgi:hypothetical protein
VLSSPPFLNREDGGKPIDGWNPHAASAKNCMRQGHVDVSVGSPPYAETPVTDQGNFESKKCPKSKKAKTVKKGYSDVDVAVGSPPYAGEGAVLGNHNGIDYSKAKDGSKNKTPAREASGLNYGQTPGQLGSMNGVISSPPYAEGLGHGGINNPLAEEKGIPAALRNNGYGGDKSNIANLKEGDVDSLVSSPPWEKNAEGALRKEKFKDPEAFAAAMIANDGQGNRHAASKKARLAQINRDAGKVYGQTEGQVGNVTGETFWKAAKTILEQVFQLLRAGGHAAWIVKDYVKSGKRVPFCDNWARLCESVGFQVVQRARCHLVKETTHAGLFGDVTKRTERKSFFRRLHERKPGAVRIDWEEVVFVVKP